MGIPAQSANSSATAKSGSLPLRQRLPHASADHFLAGCSTSWAANSIGQGQACSVWPQCSNASVGPACPLFEEKRVEAGFVGCANTCTAGLAVLTLSPLALRSCLQDWFNDGNRRRSGGSAFPENSALASLEDASLGRRADEKNSEVGEASPAQAAWRIPLVLKLMQERMGVRVAMAQLVWQYVPPHICRCRLLERDSPFVSDSVLGRIPKTGTCLEACTCSQKIL